MSLTPNLASMSPSPHAAIPENSALALISKGALHEFYGESEADAPSLCAFALLLGAINTNRATLWVRQTHLAAETGEPHPPGMAELGVDPTSLLFVRASDGLSALQAGFEGARCAALNAVMIEMRGEARAYDLTASRRLALAAKTSGVPVFLLRTGAKAQASAAQTRWRVRAAPSRALAGKALGPPAFHLTLLRARNGQEGLHYDLEWSRDARTFERRLTDFERRLADSDLAGSDLASSAPATPIHTDPWPVPPLSRALASISFDRAHLAQERSEREKWAG
jgi:protein ImuA